MNNKLVILAKHGRISFGKTGKNYFIRYPRKGYGWQVKQYKDIGKAVKTFAYLFGKAGSSGKAGSTGRKHNPVKGTRIYGKVDFIGATKTDGKYKGKPFIHHFRRRASIMGMPDGSIRIVPAGRK